MKRYIKSPTRCIEKNPTSQSILLGGRFINLSAVARDVGVDQSYLSRVLSGKRPPSIKYARKIADALGYTTIDDLMHAIEERKTGLERDSERAVWPSAIELT